MTHRGHGALGIFALITAIAFAFGPRAARIVVGTALVAGAVCFVYVLARIMMGTI